MRLRELHPHGLRIPFANNLSILNNLLLEYYNLDYLRPCELVNRK
jgi:hypothetical protein